MTTTKTWNIDTAHSGVHFSVRHMVISKVRGSFGSFAGTVTWDDADPRASAVEATLDVGSIDTGVGQRDDHLRSPDFFDAQQFPQIAFKSRGVEPKGTDRLRVTGDLTIHGVTREVDLDVELGGRAKDPWGNERAGFSATGKLNRADFGLHWNQALETGGVVVSDEVKLSIDVEVVKQAGVAETVAA